MNKPLFSIIVASYNNGKYLSECLDSLINQSYENIEIIVVDDASIDNSVEIIKEYKKKDERVKVFLKHKNRGVGHTKKMGVNKAKGEIIGTIGADDKLDVQAIDLMVKWHLKNPKTSLIYSTHYICDENLNIIKLNQNIMQVKKDETYLTMKNYTSDRVSSFRTFKKTAYLKTLGFDSHFIKAVDKDIIFKLEEVGDIIFVPKPLYYYRHHKGSISLNKNAWQAKLWEVRAKEKAYKRRLNTNILNISKEKLLNEYHYTYKMLSAETLKNKNYWQYIVHIINYGIKFKSLKKMIIFGYYTLKKHYNPKVY